MVALGDCSGNETFGGGFSRGAFPLTEVLNWLGVSIFSANRTNGSSALGLSWIVAEVGRIWRF